MNMTAIKSMDITLPFALKQEQEVNEDEIDEDANLNELDDKIFPMPLPSITDNNFLLPSTPDHKFLRLTAMVRTVYFSYLHDCLLNNYIVCYKERNKEAQSCKLQKCADQMELDAVRCSLESSLYRKHMLKMISDIKSHTSEKKVYKQLVMLLETPSNKIDVGVQTNSLKTNVCDQRKSNTMQDACITSNYEELSNATEILSVNKKLLPCKEESNISMQDNASVKTVVFKEEDTNKLIFNEESQETTILTRTHLTDTSVQQQQPIENIDKTDEISQDSLLQHMEDMFCESDDSSDLTTLIEKHSGISKASVDKEISKMSLETDNNNPLIRNLKQHVEESNNIPKSSIVKMSSSPAQGKFSFSYYKEMKSRVDKPTEHDKEGTTIECKQEPTNENKQKKRTDGIWFVERVHQVSKLKRKMTELSLMNYRKHGRIKRKFIKLFGDSDEEEMMPDSPICIEEHLTACKERIAPWIVKYLMPFYKKRRIKDRQLFKAVAKHIADKLIIENTFPEESCVNKYIDNYFRNRQFIKTNQDIYM